MPPKLEKASKEKNLKLEQKGQSINLKLTQLLKTYESQCQLMKSSLDKQLKSSLKKFADESKLQIRVSPQDYLVHKTFLN